MVDFIDPPGDPFLLLPDRNAFGKGMRELMIEWYVKQHYPQLKTFSGEVKAIAPGVNAALAIAAAPVIYDAGTYFAPGKSVISGSSIFLKLSTAAAGTAPVNGTDWYKIPRPGMELISSVTVGSPVAAVDFTGGIDATYDEYEIHLQNVIPTTDGQSLQLRTSANAGSSFASASGDYGGIYSNPDSGAASTFTGGGSTSGVLTSIPLGGGAGNDTNEMGWSGVVRIIQPALSQYCVVLFHGAYVTSAGTLVNVSGAGIRRAAAIVNAVRFLFNSGNIQSGKFKLYGVQRV